MFNPFERPHLFEEHSDGGGGGGEHQEPTEPTEPTEEPKAEPLTLEAILSGLNTKLPDLIKTTVSPVITNQLNGLDAKIDKRLKALEKKAEPPKPKTDDKLDNPFWEEEKAAMQERLQSLEQQNKDNERVSQERELDAEVKSSISDFPWTPGSDGKASPGKEIAFDYYKAKAKRNEQGELVIQDVPLNKFVRQHAAIHFKSYFTARELGSSGAAKGNAPKGAFDLDSIKPGMSADEDKTAQAAIIAALGQLRNR